MSYTSFSVGFKKKVKGRYLLGNAALRSVLGIDRSECLGERGGDFLMGDYLSC